MAVSHEHAVCDVPHDFRNVPCSQLRQESAEEHGIAVGSGDPHALVGGENWLDLNGQRIVGVRSSPWPQSKARARETEGVDVS
jgi:hypothetical protein